MHVIFSPEIMVFGWTKTYFSSKVSVPIKVKLFEDAFWDYLEK